MNLNKRAHRSRGAAPFLHGHGVFPRSNSISNPGNLPSSLVPRPFVLRLSFRVFRVFRGLSIIYNYRGG